MSDFSPAFFDSLHAMSKEMLSVYCQPCDEKIWLFPKLFYDHIPDGFQLIDIFGEPEVFKKGVTDSDTCEGFLAYGIIPDFAK